MRPGMDHIIYKSFSKVPVCFFSKKQFLFCKHGTKNFKSQQMTFTHGYFHEDNIFPIMCIAVTNHFCKLKLSKAFFYILY